jgi:hypothetical protein
LANSTDGLLQKAVGFYSKKPTDAAMLTAPTAFYKKPPAFTVKSRRILPAWQPNPSALL